MRLSATRLTATSASGKLSLGQQAISAIRRSSGTLLLVPDNYAGVFEDSTGGTPVDARGDPIGRINDRVGANNATQATASQKPIVGRVPKVISSNLFTGSYLTGTSVSATYSGNEATATFGGWIGASPNNWLTIPGSAVVGKTTVVEFWATWVSGGSLDVGRTYSVGATITAAANAGVRTKYKVEVDSAFSFAGRGTVTFGSQTVGSVWRVELITVYEVSAWTTAITFDGTNDFLTAGTITTGNEGWLCAGVTFSGAAGVNETVFANGAGSAVLKGVWFLRNSTSNNLRFGIGNGTALTQPVSNTLNLLNTPRVVEGGWTASTVFAAVDGIEASLARTGDATPAPNTPLIGTYSSTVHPLNGPMTAFIYCPVLPSPADRALIRKWVGSLQGQVL